MLIGIALLLGYEISQTSCGMYFFTMSQSSLSVLSVERSKALTLEDVPCRHEIPAIQIQEGDGDTVLCALVGVYVQSEHAYGGKETVHNIVDIKRLVVSSVLGHTT